MPDWLFEECYHAVGDFAETIALLLPARRSRSSDAPSPTGWRSGCSRSAVRTTDGQREAMVRAWRELDDRQRFVWNKLITGELPRRRLAAVWWCARSREVERRRRRTSSPTG